MRVISLCILLLFSTKAFAQFDINGEGTVYLVNGRSQQFDFGFNYFRQEGSYRFIAGRYNLVVQSVPLKFSLALILQDENQVWVPDFINEPLRGFELEIDEYTLKLYQQENDEGKTVFAFSLNGEVFFFDRGPGQVNFLFNEDGIREVRVEGMFKPRK